MKKIIVRALLFSLAIVLAASAPAAALIPSVYYDGGVNNFTIFPGTEWETTDLFPDFKYAMPGDSLKEKIVIRNNVTTFDYIKVYLRAEAHDDEDNPLSESVANYEDLDTMNEFLSRLTLRVYNGAESIYHGSLNDTDGLAENVFIAELPQGASKELTALLIVPSSLGNKYQHRVGEVDWVITIEGFVDEKKCDDSCCCRCDNPSDDKPKEDDPEEDPKKDDDKTTSDITIIDDEAGKKNCNCNGGASGEQDGGGKSPNTVDRIMHFVGFFIFSVFGFIGAFIILRSTYARLQREKAIAERDGFKTVN